MSNLTLNSLNAENLTGKSTFQLQKSKQYVEVMTNITFSPEGRIVPIKLYKQRKVMSSGSEVGDPKYSLRAVSF